MSITATPTTIKRTIFTGIDPAAIRHPLDRMATDQLKKLRGLDTLIAKYIELRYERLQYVLNSASNVKVGPKQLPLLYNMLHESCAVLDMPEPELYVSQATGVNASTFGCTKPYIVLGTGLLDLLDDAEVMGVIAHELGHIKCGHVLYQQIARSIDSIIVFAKDFLPVVGQVVGMGIDLTLKMALQNWQRRCELSADRAALLVMQRPQPCVSMLAKLAGGTSRLADQLDSQEFLRQAQMYTEEKDQAMSNRFYHLLAGMYQGTHPFTVERVKYLHEWIESSEYKQLLAGNYPRLAQRTQGEAPSGKSKYCRTCGHPLDLKDKFCAGCGQPFAH